MTIKFDTGLTFKELYSGICYTSAIASANRFDQGCANNTWYEMDIHNFGDGARKWQYVEVSWTNHDTAYGYNCSAYFWYHPHGTNTSSSYQSMNYFCGNFVGDHEVRRGVIGGFGTHTSTDNLQIYMKMLWSWIGAGTYPPVSLYIYTNKGPSSSAGDPTIRIYEVHK